MQKETVSSHPPLLPRCTMGPFLTISLKAMALETQLG